MALPYSITSTRVNHETLFERLTAKETKMAVIGLGTTGLAVALQMASKFKVIGYDRDHKTISEIQLKKDPNRRLFHNDFMNKDFHPIGMSKLLELAAFFIITTPLTTNDDATLNCTALKKDVATVARHLNYGDVIVFQNNVATTFINEVCIPILEQISGLVHDTDFSTSKVPVSANTFSKDQKTISINDSYVSKVVTKVYKTVTSTVENDIKTIVEKINTATESSNINKPCSVLLKGITRKENSRNLKASYAAKLYLALSKSGYAVTVQDNHAYPSEVQKLYGIELNTRTNKHFDVIILAVDHDNYAALTYQDYLKNAKVSTLFFDVKGDKGSVFPKEKYMTL